MAQFKYSAQDASGEIQKGTIEADTKDAAVAALKKKSMRPLAVETQKKSAANIQIKMPGSNKVKNEDIVIFTRQLATMINAGVPLIQSLATMRDQTDSEALQAVLDKVVVKVQSGIPLSEALAEHPKVFSPVYINMVKAGEEGGILDQIMERLAIQEEKDAEIRGKLKSALTYPAVVMIVAIGAVTFLLTNIIPNFGEIFEQYDMDLPIQTRILLGLSDFLVSNAIGIVIAIVGSIVALLRWKKTPKGKFLFDKFLLKAPIFGTVVLKVNVARFAQTFSSLTGAGVSVVNALEVTSGALSNAVIQKAILDSVASIKNGEPISKSLVETGIFPPIITQMTAVGEETGQIDVVLEKVAEFYTKEVDRTVESISSIIEPVLIVGLGGAVALIVASVFGPLSEITGGI